MKQKTVSDATNTNHYDWSIFLSSARCGVQNGNDIIRGAAVEPRWNSNHAVLWRGQWNVVSAVLLWRRGEQRLGFHYQVTCTVQHHIHLNTASSYSRLPSSTLATQSTSSSTSLASRLLKNPLQACFRLGKCNVKCGLHRLFVVHN